MSLTPTLDKLEAISQHPLLLEAHKVMARFLIENIRTGVFTLLDTFSLERDLDDSLRKALLQNRVVPPTSPSPNGMIAWKNERVSWLISNSVELPNNDKQILGVLDNFLETFGRDSEYEVCESIIEFLRNGDAMRLNNYLKESRFSREVQEIVETLKGDEARRTQLLLRFYLMVRITPRTT